jgi:hypothetical protein
MFLFSTADGGAAMKNRDAETGHADAAPTLAIQSPHGKELLCLRLQLATK